MANGKEPMTTKRVRRCLFSSGIIMRGLRPKAPRLQWSNTRGPAADKHGICSLHNQTRVSGEKTKRGNGTAEGAVGAVAVKVAGAVSQRVRDASCI